jgi:hyperosmotically inducible protein
MNTQKSRYVIAGGMAAVVGIGVAAFALTSHPATLAARPPLSSTPAAQMPEAVPPSVAQVPDAPAAAESSTNVGTKSADTATTSAVEPKLARNPHPAKAGTNAVATNDTVRRAGSAADTSEKPARQTVANGVEPVKSAVELTPPPAISSSAADDNKVRTSTEVAASDSQITTDVKSEIAGDSSLSKDAHIGVTTSAGVVALTGSLASQDAIDHVKDVAGRVKDVKSVDTSALLVASL